MDLQQKTNLISIVVILICIVLGIVIYTYTGNILIAIIVAPPIIHWILRKKEKE